MTIINKLAKLSVQRLVEKTNFFTSFTIKNAINQFKTAVYTEAEDDKKIITIAKKITEKTPRNNFVCLPLSGLDFFLHEMQRFIFIAESLLKDRVEEERGQHVIRRLALLTILQIEALGEESLRAEEKQALYDFTQLALGLKTTDKMMLDFAYQHQQQLIDLETKKWLQFGPSNVLYLFRRFLFEGEILRQWTNKNKSVVFQSTTRSLVAPLNLDENTFHKKENDDSDDTKTSPSDDKYFDQNLDDILGLPMTDLQKSLLPHFKL